MIINYENLNTLADQILAGHSYQFDNFMVAKAVVSDEHSDLFIEYDRLSLYFYNHNLEPSAYSYIGSRLAMLFKKKYNRNEQKARREYFSLLLFTISCPEYQPYKIQKTEHPDFIMSLDSSFTERPCIGIEVTELITQDDSKIFKIAEEFPTVLVQAKN